MFLESNPVTEEGFPNFCILDDKLISSTEPKKIVAAKWDKHFQNTQL